MTVFANAHNYTLKINATSINQRLSSRVKRIRHFAYFAMRTVQYIRLGCYVYKVLFLYVRPAAGISKYWGKHRNSGYFCIKILTACFELLCFCQRSFVHSKKAVFISLHCLIIRNVFCGQYTLTLKGSFVLTASLSVPFVLCVLIFCLQKVPRHPR